ncbi:hypothetical protein [Rhodovulum sulfidophilum]|uniref:hypothetical protein n=1 Tax=Rhodovulum sulfidophilum TaxID=35806 RepID=UPI001F2C42D4|nr:hypothetical protein [Rhodovulum sulfidophilum]MCE8442013.1 hypothetical protein [Rhodovulum sulfidophilum]
MTAPSSGFGLLCAGLLVFFCPAHAVEAAESLTLGFGSGSTSPVVVTHFSIEQPLMPVSPFIAASEAERRLPRMAGANVLSVPQDRHRDGVWSLSAQWVELPTGKSWRASVEIPIRELTIAFDAYELAVLFGPNGELTIGSDRIGRSPSDRRDVVTVCAERVPSADKDWKAQTGYFPELPYVMKFSHQDYLAGLEAAKCPSPMEE